ncbi:MAG: hypothetical protein RI897_606 [Verrucomicrobiota bacterium]
MPVVRGGNDDRVDLGVGQEVVVIDVGFDVGVAATFDTFLAVGCVGIADRDHLDIGEWDDRVDEVAAAGAESDAADADGFFWCGCGEDIGCDGGCGGERGSLAGGLEELSAREGGVCFHGLRGVRGCGVRAE